MSTSHIRDEVSSRSAIRLPDVDGPNNVTCTTEVGAITVALGAAVMSTLANRGVPGGQWMRGHCVPRTRTVAGPGASRVRNRQHHQLEHP